MLRTQPFSVQVDRKRSKSVWRRPSDEEEEADSRDPGRAYKRKKRPTQVESILNTSGSRKEEGRPT